MDRRPSETSHILEELKALRQRVSEMELAETDRNRAWDRVRESEEHYRAAVENVADAIVINVGTTRVFVTTRSCLSTDWMTCPRLPDYPSTIS